MAENDRTPSGFTKTYQWVAIFFVFFHNKTPFNNKKAKKKIEPNPFPSDSVIIIKKVCYCALP